MAKQIYLQKAEFPEFGGIDARYSHTGGTASSADVVNFRITPDGSLQKRCGFRRLLTAAAPVRAVWSGKILGKWYGVVLAGAQVSYLDLSAGTLTAAGTVGTSQGQASFFFYRDTLYLTDGTSVYRVTPDSVTADIGYLPLLTLDWDAVEMGEIHEPLNLLTRRARLSYLVKSLPTGYFRSAGMTVESVEAVYKNGTLLSPTLYSYDADTKSLVVPSLAVGDRIEAFVTFPASELPYRANKIGAANAYTFGGITESRVFLWNRENGGTVYPSAYVPDEDLKAAGKSAPGSGALYFPAGHARRIGDGRYHIRALTRQFDRLLVFTDGDLWKTENAVSGLSELPSMNINTAIGCGSDNGALSLGNFPVSVGEHTLYRWTSETEELNDCNAESISAGIDSLLPEGFYQKAGLFYDRWVNELWLYAPGVSSDAWIYSPVSRKWVRFTGITADGFFDADGAVGFFSGNGIYVFDPALTADYPNAQGATLSAPRGITASWKSNRIHFSDKPVCRLGSVSLCTDAGTAPLRLRFSGNGIRTSEWQVSASAPCTNIHRRLCTGRTDAGTLELICDGNAGQTVHNLTLALR